MTGWAENSNIPEPLSKITVGLIEDLGYSVNYNAADPYVLPQTHTYYVITNGFSYEFYTNSENTNLVAKSNTSDKHIFANLNDNIILNLQNISSMHPFKIVGLTDAKTSGTIQFVMQQDSYTYVCQNHGSMTGKILTRN
jgi:hypothetical protein